MEKKKHPKLFLINFANFDDILTLIQSNERKKYEVFVEKNFATKNQKWHKKQQKTGMTKNFFWRFLPTLGQKSKLFLAGVPGHHIRYISGFICSFLSFWDILQPDRTISGYFTRKIKTTISSFFTQKNMRENKPIWFFFKKKFFF